MVGNNTDDFGAWTSASSSYNCSDDDDVGTNKRTPSSLDWDNELADANNGDFTIVTGGNCIDNGTDDPGSGIYSDDIIGTTRTSTWSIGAYEDGLGSGTVPKMVFISGNLWEKFIKEGIQGKWKIAA